MKRIWLAVVAVLVLAAAGHSATYKIDPSHSQVMFKVKHLGISTVSGQFEKFEGTFSYDPKKLSESKAEAVIDVASINTKISKRDDHLRSADFFKVEEFPTMTFKSTGAKREELLEEDAGAEGEPAEEQEPAEFIVSGDLTLRGVTKRVELMVRHTGTVKDMQGSERIGFVAETEINRKDYGLTWSKLLESGSLVVGEEVWIVIEIEAVRQTDDDLKGSAGGKDKKKK